MQWEFDSVTKIIADPTLKATFKYKNVAVMLFTHQVSHLE